MLDDEQLEEIRRCWAPPIPYQEHWPGCYRQHPSCAIDALIHDLKYWRGQAPPTLETKSVAMPGNPREKELLATCEKLDGLLQSAMDGAVGAYLTGHDLLREAQGKPPENEPVPRKRKRPGKAQPPRLDSQPPKLP